MMDTFTALKGATSRCGCHGDMFSNIALLGGIGVFRLIDIPIASIIEGSMIGVAPLQYSAPTPIIVGFSHLIPGGSRPSRNSELLHGTPNNFLCRSKFLSDFTLAHALNNISVVKFVCRKWRIIRILVNHAGVILSADASIIPAKGGDVK